MDFSCDAMVKVIGSNLHNLEELFLGYLMEHGSDVIECLVTGCPKLKVLQVGRRASIRSACSVLLGLPNLIEFHYPLMIVALQKTIKDEKADMITNHLRNIYIGKQCFQHAEDGLANVDLSDLQTLIRRFQITKIKVTADLNMDKSSASFIRSISKLKHLTELRLAHVEDWGLFMILKSVGHQLEILDIHCDALDDHIYPWSDAIDQCRELRVLRLQLKTSIFLPSNRNYGNNLQEKYTSFQKLQELHLVGFEQSYVYSVVFKSMITSPVLRTVILDQVSGLTDHVLQAALEHTNSQGEQLAFTSLTKLTLIECPYITNYVEDLVTLGKVPLTTLCIKRCANVDGMFSWNLGRFDMNSNCSRAKLARFSRGRVYIHYRDSVSSDILFGIIYFVHSPFKYSMLCWMIIGWYIGGEKLCNILPHTVRYSCSSLFNTPLAMPVSVAVSVAVINWNNREI